MKKCKFCDKPIDNGYQLCKNCYELKQQGLIAICPDCGDYYPTDDICLCHIKNEFVNTNNSNCIICKSESYGYLFCAKCFYKYRHKDIYLKISNCEKIELLENNYKSPYICDDGHHVKSQQEALIDNYLFNHNFRHVYEKAFPIDENKEHDLHPDFYLPDLDIYIEHWGMKNDIKYEETKEYKIPFYKKSKITLICTNGDDIANINANLERKLKFFKKGIVNWLE